MSPREPVEVRFARNMAAVRVYRGFDQATLARKVGIDQSYVSLIEGAKRTIPIDLAEKIADALRVDVGRLFSGEDPFITRRAP